MQQQVTLQINTKTMLKVMMGMILAIPAAILLTLAVLIPSIAKADTSQTANANPSINIPAGYALVPAGTGGTCSASTSTEPVALSGGSMVPVAFSSVLPGSYTSTINQTHNETNNDYDYTDSNNETNLAFDLRLRNVGNGNGSNNGNTTDSNNPITTTTTTTTTTATSNTNVGNTNNSVNNSNNNNGNTDNSDAVVVSVVDSLNDNFRNNTVTLP